MMDLVTRTVSYCDRHGFGATARRAWLGLTRAIRWKRQVLFYCDLQALDPLPRASEPDFRVERKDADVELDSRDLLQIVNFWNPDISRRQMSERFGKGASLWLVKAGEQLAGYGWTLRGRTIEPHYYPLGDDDVHLFDFLVYPDFRGQGINPFLVLHILEQLVREHRRRAFIEAAEWNTAQLHSLGKTPFLRFGCGRRFSIFGKTFVSCTRETNSF